jgi:hypothetical protein
MKLLGVGSFVLTVEGRGVATAAEIRASLLFVAAS